MILQTPRLRESLVTLEAGIRFLSGVDSHVSPQGSCPGEGLCTLKAGVRSLATVCPLVRLQVTGVGERLATGGAGEELFSSVG